MFKWLKKIIGTEITDSVTAPTPTVDVAVAVEPVAAVADTGTAGAETKTKRTRTKKTDAAPKKSAQATPPKNAKTAK